MVCVKTRAHKTSGKTGNVQAMLQQGSRSSETGRRTLGLGVQRLDSAIHRG